MTGGLMQLVAYGAQDIYLTGNPQITFFKIVYRRHTNFAMETVLQSLTGDSTASTTNKLCSSIISRNGDLVTNLYITSSTADIVNGDAIIDDCMIEIGGQKIDKHYKEWMQIWAELTTPESKSLAYKNMTGSFSHSLNKTDSNTPVGANLIQIPILFWFCRNPGLALPVIALQYHEIKIKITLGLSTDIGTSSNACDAEIKLFVDYIYLDTDERRRFAQVSHEYLIEQVQFTGDESVSSVSNKIKLNFNHPCKELIWVVQPDDNILSSVTGGPQWFNYTTEVDDTWGTGVVGSSLGSYGAFTGSDAMGATYNVGVFDSGVNPVVDAKLQLNGHDRFSVRDGDYFNYVQPYQHHENVPSVGVNVYSFGLKPEEHQPSGTCNMSRIDNATLHLTLSSDITNDSKVRVYATSYNVLRIMSGMGGLAYSN